MPRLIPFFAILSSFAWVLPAPAANPPAEDWATFDKPSKFITALCATDEALWIGTEDRGLWRLDLKADPAKPEAWRQFTAQDTATDHVYGIAVDALGRLWVGTVNQGVSVYNGKEWRNYGVLGGCLGERVFAIAADPDPKRGNVWIGTDHGLVCWLPDLAVSPAGAKGTWRTYTQADGLPSQQIYAVAVAPSGRVWAGTECDGLAWDDPPYRKWNPVRAAAERSGDAGELPGLGGGTAPGLPSNLTNGLAILRNGTVVVSTDYGLGIGRSGGLVWTSWQGLSKQPYENYTRGLAADSAGGLWIATRHKGLARLDPNTGKVKTYQQPAVPDNYVFAVAVDNKGDVWAGTYGGGLARLKRAASAPTVVSSVVATPRSEFRAPSLVPPPLPAPLGPPTLDELNAMLASLAKVPFVPPEKQPQVIRLDDDWLTKGDWLGRYGRYWACLCAASSTASGLPKNYIWGAGPEKVQFCPTIGPNRDKGDSLRYWVHWQQTTNPNSLELTSIYLHSRVLRGLTTWEVNRRQAEWDDHSEAYAMSKDGPHLFCTLRVPAGLYTLSLYNFNKDGHGGNNRFRDYRLSIKAHIPSQELYEISGFEKQQELARGRMRDFWNGAYKRFLVRGPTEITFNLSRNHSFNTILAGVFLDLVDEYPVPYFQSVAEWRQTCAEREKERQALQAEWSSGGARLQRFRPGRTEAEAAARLFDEVERMRLVNPVWWSRESRPFYAAALRWTLKRLIDAPPGPDNQHLCARAATCCYQVGLYEKWEAGQVILGLEPARRIEKSLRWDEKTAFNGRGYEVLSSQRWQASNPGMTVLGAAARP